MAGVPSSCSSAFYTSAAVNTTGTRRFTLARTTPLRSPGSTPRSRPLPPMLQPDQGRGRALLKVALHGISDLPLQQLQAVCLRVNGGADGAGPVGGLIGLVYDKKDFVYCFADLPF